MLFGPTIATWVLKKIGLQDEIPKMRLRWHKKLDKVMLTSAEQADANDRIQNKIADAKELKET